ncbi:hypothetical protein T01_7103 [Trichinella spiralis]|uniref:HAT C-terminal dimerisation domain-containing protein n=1 Tax=Trichinella spiralis TaxID=6334 RepID=A0A0V1BC36_TRISP|nr:hypothetical protein T01_7103 [Trichinella spiralis]
MPIYCIFGETCLCGKLQNFMGYRLGRIRLWKDLRQINAYVLNKWPLKLPSVYLNTQESRPTGTPVVEFWYAKLFRHYNEVFIHITHSCSIFPCFGQLDFSSFSVHFELVEKLNFTMLCNFLESSTANKRVSFPFFPNISRNCKLGTAGLGIFTIYPVASASAERSFTAVKYLKSYFRTTMTEERLNGLAVMCTFILSFSFILS